MADEDQMMRLLAQMRALGIDPSSLLDSDSDADSDSSGPAAPDPDSDADDDYTPDGMRSLDQAKKIGATLAANAARQLQVGDICVWEEGMQNRRWPHKNEPVVVIFVAPEPICDEETYNSGSPYFREPLSVRVMGADPGRTYFLDGRRLRKIGSCYE